MRRLITSDSHILPPPWLVKELPEKLRQHIPSSFDVEERADGRYVVPVRRAGEADAAAMKLMDLTSMFGGASSEVKVESDADIAKVINFTATSIGANGRWDAEGRLEDMRREGVEAAVLIGVPELAVPQSEEAVQAQKAYYRVLNDWLYEEYKDHLDVFAPGISLPWMDVDACVKELERCAALGMRPGLLPDAIYTHLYWNRDWEPLWEAADSLKVPLSLHISGINTPEWAEFGVAPRWSGHGYESFWSAACDQGRTLLSLVFNGMFQKYPNLRITMTEGYAFWMAGLMQFLDHLRENRFGQQLEMAGFGDTPPPVLEAPPSYYIKRQCAATFMYDPVAIRNRDLTGLECLMWGNDYPHPEGVFPDSQQWVDKQFAGVPEAEIEQMTFTNAKELFGFKV